MALFEYLQRAMGRVRSDTVVYVATPDRYKELLEGAETMNPFTINPARQINYRIDEHGKRVYSWQKSDGDWVRLADMKERHLLQVKQAMEEQGLKFRLCWYLFDQELRRRNVAMTGRLTRRNGRTVYRSVGYKESA
jgi:hypothetical protein